MAAGQGIGKACFIFNTLFCKTVRKKSERGILLENIS